jgi:hypothetical protein
MLPSMFPSITRRIAVTALIGATLIVGAGATHALVVDDTARVVGSQFGDVRRLPTDGVPLAVTLAHLPAR